jgi:hydroxymethylbilane synthase
MKVRIAARRSDLARLQAYRVGEALHSRGHEVDYLFKESLGDKNQNDPLWKLPERGVFTEDFVSDLHEGRADLVVHSWKDLPTEPRPGLAILATMERADPRDLFLLRNESFGKAQLELLTSSPRRTFAAGRFLAPLLPFPAELSFKPVRGNILTRLKKLVAGEGDGLFMAKAALDRLLSAQEEELHGAQAELRSCLERTKWMVLPLSHFPTAPAQGALAIEGLSARNDLKELLAPLHCGRTARDVEEERRLFSSFGGGCHQKIGLIIEEHPRLGKLEFFHGMLDSGEIRHSLKAEKSPPPPGESCWPLRPSSLFEREPLRPVHPGTDLFVSRATALPEQWKLGDEILWCAGIESWRKLAERGHWVHGCSDGLGERPPEMEALAGRPGRFTKLTHDRSEEDGTFPLLFTYRLLPKLLSEQDTPPRVDYYFWMSASGFRRALELRPEIRSARHASGPGSTAKAIERILERPIDVYINYRHWKTGEPFGNETPET